MKAESSSRIRCFRNAEFSTSSTDRPLIVQFASHDPEEFALAAEMVSPLSDGVDLNCGCPQRWAIQEHYGLTLSGFNGSNLKKKMS